MRKRARARVEQWNGWNWHTIPTETIFNACVWQTLPFHNVVDVVLGFSVFEVSFFYENVRLRSLSSHKARTMEIHCCVFTAQQCTRQWTLETHDSFIVAHSTQINGHLNTAVINVYDVISLDKMPFESNMHAGWGQVTFLTCRDIFNFTQK